MAVSSIGNNGLSALEKAQMLSSFKQNQATSLVSGLSASSDSVIGSDLMYDIYDQKALTPRILAATLAKSAAAGSSTEESSSTTDSTTTGTSTNASTGITDSIISQSVAANSSAVPTTRPESLTGLKNVDLSA